MSEDLKKTKEAIRKQGAKWKADETSMSELTPEERGKRLGLLPSEDELEESKKKASQIRSSASKKTEKITKRIVNILTGAELK